jgi:hypothetical protein
MLIKKSNDLIRNRTRYLPAYSIVPQPTMLLRAPVNKDGHTIKGSSKTGTLSSNPTRGMDEYPRLPGLYRPV